MKRALFGIGVVVGVVVGVVLSSIIVLSQLRYSHSEEYHASEGPAWRELSTQFAALDSNANRRLDFNEVPRALRYQFNDMDTNNDGVLTRAEITVMPTRQSLNENIPPIIGSVQLIANIPYAETDNPRQMLDLMLPLERGAEPLPVLVYIHGGAWAMGDKWWGIEERYDLARSGEYAVVSVAYRLSGEAIWPAQIHDCKAAIRWIRANGPNYGIDPDRIGVWGHSAGGHLVAMLGVSPGDPDIDGQVGPNTHVPTDVACAVDYFGPTDLEGLAETDWPDARNVLTQLFGGPIENHLDAARDANPINYVSAKSPPFLIIHGTQDELVPLSQSTLLLEALRGAGVEVTMTTVDGGGHGEGFGPEIAAEAKRFFDHHLRGEPSQWQDASIPAVRP